MFLNKCQISYGSPLTDGGAKEKNRVVDSFTRVRCLCLWSVDGPAIRSQQAKAVFDWEVHVHARNRVVDVIFASPLSKCAY